MACYEKKIVYLSCMEYGNKIKSAGFIKVENRDDNCCMDMHISGMNELQEKMYEICMVKSGKASDVIGKIYICGGCGEWREEFKLKRSSRDGMEPEEIDGICIKISDIKMIEGKMGGTKENVKQKGNSIEEKTSEKRKTDAEKDMEKLPRTDMRIKKWKRRAAEKIAACEAKTNTDSIEDAIRWEEDADPIETAKEIKIENVILNDKWEQLQSMYPVVHPYEDDRKYISVKPKDFVIMTGDCQHLANNSFLLHGFYNYRHIILGKEQGEGSDKKANESFYLGVPGVYYEREKMVALMFGFEAFECAGGAAEAGKFGYYLRKVKI